MLNNISGFPELLPKEQVIFNRVLNKLKDIFEFHGFTPLNTAAVEKITDLVSKGDDKEIYTLQRLEESAQPAKIGLRFDLTIPLARYVSQNRGHLTFPYKRYHIAPVWRGERAQAGRYRQFYQADIDIVGENLLDFSNDAELLSIATKGLQQIYGEFAIESPTLVLKVNHPAILTTLLTACNVPSELLFAVTRIIDKRHKITPQQFIAELNNLSLNDDTVAEIFTLVQNNDKLPPRSIVTTPEDVDKEFELVLNQSLAGYANLPVLNQSVKELRNICYDAAMLGLSGVELRFDPTLARGLNYYTGMICEFVSSLHPTLGSICGGGRYANLASGFGKNSLPGVGLSIGFSRLILKLIEDYGDRFRYSSSAKVLVTMQEQALRAQYFRIVSALRDAGISSEIYMDDKVLAKQLLYADRKGYPFAVIANAMELADDKLVLRNLETGEQQSLSLQAIIAALS